MIPCLTLLACVFLMLSLNPIKAAITVLLYIMTCMLILLTRGKKKVRFEKKYLSLNAAILLFAVSQFYSRWIPSSKVKELAGLMYMSPAHLLVVIGTAAALFALYGLNLLCASVGSLVTSHSIEAEQRRHDRVLNIIWVLLILFLQLFQLQRSALDVLGDIIKVKPVLWATNLLVLLFLDVLLSLICQNQRIGLTIGSVFITLVSILNYYVILFHGSPLFPSEIANAGTALNVISQYRPTAAPELADIGAFFLAEWYIIGISSADERRDNTARRNLTQGAVIAVSAAVINGALFSPHAMNASVQFAWRTGVRDNGYLCCAMSNVKNMLDPIRTPNGYDSEKIRMPEVKEHEKPDVYPDIILIINESFCNLDDYSSVGADSDYLRAFYDINGAYYGHTFSSSIGGGTNNSEFEVLTSNSMFLLANSAPFNYLRFNDKRPTVVSYLKSLGYSSTAMHSMEASNYSRHIAYPAMGFDHIELGDGDFSKLNYYGNRLGLDSDDYQGMISLYEKSGDEPQFFYLLTFQNHGDYEQNEDKWDRVHTTKDYGDLSDDINEYLTSVSMSADALHKLTDYFSGVDRPVILCMVGDHAPWLIKQLNANRPMTEKERDIMQREVPYILWSNYDLDISQNTELASMTDLISMILSAAKMPLTPYYQGILDLHKVLPVRTSDGDYLDAEETIGTWDENSPYYEQLSQYYYMEYNGLSGGEDYREELFSVKEAVS